MSNTKRVFVGEGTSEPTSGFEYVRNLFKNEPVVFYFGVRRSSEGIESIPATNTRIVANFPGRGMRQAQCPIDVCNLSTYSVNQLVKSGRLRPDAVLIVATPPDANGVRSIGTANGPIAEVLAHAPVIIIEEDPNLKIIKGSPTIPTDREIHVIPHKPPAFSALSRDPEAIDYVIADYITTLIPDGSTIQLGVGGIIEALSEKLVARINLNSVSGAISSANRRLFEQGTLSPGSPIFGSAIVGDEDMIQWAASNPHVELLPSAKIHNPLWIADIPNFFSINIGITVDLEGNINAERIGGRAISGKGGSPNFSKGASMSRGGASIVAIRNDRGNALVDKIDRPTIPARHVNFIVTEKGIVDLRGKSRQQISLLLRDLFS